MRIKKVVSSVVTGVLALVIILVFILAISTKMNNGKTSFFGNQLMVVLSGSMSPTFDTGSLVVVAPLRFSSIKNGDIVTFKEISGRTVTHRVVEVKGSELITKGDANSVKDSEPVTQDRVIGKVNVWIPYLGYFVDFTKSRTGIALFLIIPGAYLIISQIWKLFKAMAEDEKKTQEADTQKSV